MTRTRQDIEALLPFLANDTLEGDERAAVEAAIAADPGLANELQVLERTRAQMRAEPFESSPGELGLARLMRDVEREPVVQMTPAAPAEPVGNVVPLGRLRIWQVAAALVAAVAIGQFTLGPDMSGPEAGSLAEMATQAPAGDSFALAEGETGAPLDVAFRAAFSADATEGALRALLLEAGLQIVAGPSAIGLYDLAPVSADIDLAEAAAALRGASTLVDSVEDLAR